MPYGVEARVCFWPIDAVLHGHPSPLAEEPPPVPLIHRPERRHEARLQASGESQRQVLAAGEMARSVRCLPTSIGNRRPRDLPAALANRLDKPGLSAAAMM